MYCMESWAEPDLKNQSSCEEKNRRWGESAKEWHSKVCLWGNDMHVCALEIESCCVLCYCTSTTKGCPVCPFKYLSNPTGNWAEYFLIAQEHPGWGDWPAQNLPTVCKVQLSVSNNQAAGREVESPALPLFFSFLTLICTCSIQWNTPPPLVQWSACISIWMCVVMSFLSFRLSPKKGLGIRTRIPGRGR